MFSTFKTVAAGIQYMGSLQPKGVVYHCRHSTSLNDPPHSDSYALRINRNYQYHVFGDLSQENLIHIVLVETNH